MRRTVVILFLLYSLTPLVPARAEVICDCACIDGSGFACGVSPLERLTSENCTAACAAQACLPLPSQCGERQPGEIPSDARPARPAAAPESPLPNILQSQGPAKVPFCWLADDCKQDICRGRDGCFETKPDDEYCTGGWGRCYPPEEPYRLQINIGGKASVQNLKDYIGTIWNFAAGIAGTLAVVMLIWGGIQWMVSGAMERISQAKETMRNALVGLILVLGSYVLLNTINPALTELALPRVAALRQITLGANWCRDLPKNPDGTYTYKIADAGGYHSGRYKTLEQAAAAGYTQAPNTANCNEEYYIENAGEARCLGHLCAGPVMTLCQFHSNRDRYGCDQGNIGGEVAYTAGRYLTHFDLVAVNKVWSADIAESILQIRSGNVNESSQDTPANEEQGRQAFRATLTQTRNASASNNPYAINRTRDDYLPEGYEFKGYLFTIKLNDEGAVEAQDDFLVGRSGCASGRAFKNIDFDPDYYALDGTMDGDDDGFRALRLNAAPEDFFTPDEVWKAATGEQPLICNIDTGKFRTD